MRNGFRKRASTSVRRAAASGQRTATHDRRAKQHSSILAEFAELREYAQYYLDAKLDQWKLRVRNFGFAVVLGGAGGFLLLVLLASAIWMLLTGIAGGISELFGGREWAGSLAVGVILLLGAGLGTWWGTARWKRRWHERTVRKYEKRQEEQRARFGRDVTQAAAAVDE